MRASSDIQTMTYEEWLRVQNETNSLASGSKIYSVRNSSHTRRSRMKDGGGVGDDRRNFSRTSSHASRHYGGGSWGYRAAEAGIEAAGHYRSPTARTESGRDGWHRQASVRSPAGDDIVTEQYVGEDGNVKTYLPMPWDGRLIEEEQGSESSGCDKYF